MKRDRTEAPVPTVPDGFLGQRIRSERERRDLGLRAFAKMVDVSPSFISQVENGKTRPSVQTLYTIANVLGLTLDDFFAAVPTDAAPRGLHGADNGRRDGAPRQPTDGPVQRGDRRRVLHLESGVRWERLTALGDRGVDFLYVVYEPGGSSTTDNKHQRHPGHEYGYVLAGRLWVTVGFDEYELGPNDSITFDATVPHVICNRSEEPTTAIWCVVGRHD